jgi:hypothetical protein
LLLLLQKRQSPHCPKVEHKTESKASAIYPVKRRLPQPSMHPHHSPV